MRRVPVGRTFADVHRSRAPLLPALELLSRLGAVTAFALQDLKANESRLKDINKVAEDLESEGLMAEEVQAVQQQVGARGPPRARLHGHEEGARPLRPAFP